jgi:hypothetical protein
MFRSGSALHVWWAIATLACALVQLAGVSPAQENPTANGAARILRHCVITELPGKYCAWPSIARAANGDLLVLFTRTEEHLGPDGAILCTRSTDNGASWQSPSVIYDTPIDDRESGITPLTDGVIVVHLWSTFHTRAGYEALADLSYERSTLARWSACVDSPRYRAHESMQGAWTMLSRDNGRTWSPPVRGCDAVHGGIQLHDGTLLVASYRRDNPGIGVYRAVLPDLHFTRIAFIDSPGADSVGLGEPDVLQMSSGRIIMMIRATALRYDDMSPRCVLWESYSDDNGSTWSPPFRTPLWGFPPHLLQLSDGRILCSYGYRRAPFGERACISDDGVSWTLKNEVVLRDDAPNGDLGYPASVQLDSLRILTVYYQPNVTPGTVQKMHPPDPGRTKPGILGTIWTIPRARP